MIHAITATWALDEAKNRQALSRRCPKCDNEQIAFKRQKRASLVCSNCGVPILPAGGAGGDNDVTVIGGENQHAVHRDEKK